MNVTLSQDFALRQSISESLLQNIQTGKTFFLQDDQAEFVRLLDGMKTESEVMDEFDTGSQPMVADFLKRLKEVGAISTNGKRCFAAPVAEPRLEAVHFEPSGICNMRCAHCYQGSLVKNNSTLSYGLMLKLLDEMVALQVSSISVSGGEPLLIPNLKQLLAEIEQRGMYFSALFTNGLLANTEFVEMMGSLKYKTPLYISLDSLPGHSFLFRGFNEKTAHSALSKIIDNIKLLTAAGFRVTVNTVVNTENIGILEKMYDKIADIGVFNWRLGFPKMTPNFKENVGFSADWLAIAESCFNILRKHFANGQPFSLQVEYMYRDLLFEQGFPNLTNDDYVCDYEGRRREVNIKPNGDVVSCAYCNELPIGNVYKQNLGEIWYSKSMQHIKSVKVGEVTGCSGCDLIDICGTGCRANAFFLHGDFYHSRDDYACHAMKFFRERVYPFLSEQGVI